MIALNSSQRYSLMNNDDIQPPRKDAVPSSCANMDISQRDRHIHRIRETGRSKRKREYGYYLQSHAENAMFRYKTTFGGWMKAKNSDSQEKEIALGCAILDRIREMGSPFSYPVD